MNYKLNLRLLVFDRNQIKCELNILKKNKKFYDDFLFWVDYYYETMDIEGICFIQKFLEE